MASGVNPAAQQPPLQNRVASLFVHVSDLRRSAEWYCRLFGLPLREDRLNGGPVYWFDFPGTGLILDDNSGNRRNRDWQGEKPRVMFACEDIDEAYAYILHKAEPYTEPMRHGPMAYFNFRGPDGQAYMACRPADGGGVHPAPPASRSPVHPRIGGVFVRVSDRKAADWFSDLLGVPLREKEADRSICVVGTSGGAELLLEDSCARHGEPREISFRLDTDELEAAYAYAVEQRLAVVRGIKTRGDAPCFVLADPDGHLVSVCESRESPNETGPSQAAPAPGTGMPPPRSSE